MSTTALLAAVPAIQLASQTPPVDVPPGPPQIRSDAIIEFHSSPMRTQGEIDDLSAQALELRVFQLADELLQARQQARADGSSPAPLGSQGLSRGRCFIYSASGELIAERVGDFACEIGPPFDWRGTHASRFSNAELTERLERLRKLQMEAARRRVREAPPEPSPR